MSDAGRPPCGCCEWLTRAVSLAILALVTHDPVDAFRRQELHDARSLEKGGFAGGVVYEMPSCRQLLFVYHAPKLEVNVDRVLALADPFL